jgi:transcriptional regulator with XRE-family HTH domain
LSEFTGQEELYPLPNKKTDENRTNAQEIGDALRRYLSESVDNRRQIATKIGISLITLSAWLAGEAEPPKGILAQVAGFLKRFGYLYRFRTNPGFESVAPTPQK